MEDGVIIMVAGGKASISLFRRGEVHKAVVMVARELSGAFMRGNTLADRLTSRMSVAMA
jgi:hypothetical protein